MWLSNKKKVFKSKKVHVTLCRQILKMKKRPIKGQTHFTFSLIFKDAKNGQLAKSFNFWQTV